MREFQKVTFSDPSATPKGELGSRNQHAPPMSILDVSSACVAEIVAQSGLTVREAAMQLCELTIQRMQNPHATTRLCDSQGKGEP